MQLGVADLATVIGQPRVRRPMRPGQPPRRRAASPARRDASRAPRTHRGGVSSGSGSAAHPARERADRDDDRRDLFGRRVRGRSRAGGRPFATSGTFPCLRCGSFSFFVRSMSSDSHEHAAGVARVDDVVDVAALAPRCTGSANRSVYSSTSSARLRYRVVGGLDLLAEDDVDRAVRAHHRDLGRRPREREVGADRLRVHDDERAAVAPCA